MKWTFRKVTAMIVGLAIFLLGGWIMNLVKLVNGGDLQFDAGMTLARVVGIFVVPVGSILGSFLMPNPFSALLKQIV
ncbi:hypothetical protein LNO36_29825 [Klebsiella variicola subsp. variicola]|nr:hypothetical protein [Klebsiella variicola subsp. variicola]